MHWHRCLSQRLSTVCECLEIDERHWLEYSPDCRHVIRLDYHNWVDAGYWSLSHRTRWWSVHGLDKRESSPRIVLPPAWLIPSVRCFLKTVETNPMRYRHRSSVKIWCWRRWTTVGKYHETDTGRTIPVNRHWDSGRGWCCREVESVDCKFPVPTDRQRRERETLQRTAGARSTLPCVFERRLASYRETLDWKCPVTINAARRTSRI